MSHSTIIIVFNILTHIPAFLYAGFYLYEHYVVKKRKKIALADGQQLTKEQLEKIEQAELADDTHKISHITLNLLVFIVIALLFDTFVNLYFIQKTSDEILEKTTKISEQIIPTENEVFTTGTDGIYEEVKKEFTSRANFTNRLEFDIIGYTLFSVEPKLKEWYDKGFLKNVKINLIHIDKTFASKSEFIDPTWSKRLDDHLAQIKLFMANHKVEFDKNKVEILFSSYKHIPGIHGFRFRNGRYFISFSSWDIDGRIKLPSDALYFIINKDDRRDHASSLKQMMDNWINAKVKN